MDGYKMKIMLVVDVPGWAWDHKARAIAKCLKKDFEEIRVIYLKKFRNNYSEYKNYSYHFFGWSEGSKWADKSTCGISSHNYEFKHLKRAKRILPKYLGITATSMLLYDSLKKHKLNKKIFYCANGVDEKLFPFMELPEEFAIGWVGQASTKPFDQHGYETIYKPLKEKLIKNNIHVYDSVKDWRSAVPHNQMPDFYKKISIILHTGTMTGTPNPVFEAASCGRAVISTPIGAIPEFVNDNGYIEKTVDNLYQKILFLKNNYDTCKKMGKKSRELIEKNWTWEKRAKQWIPVFLL